MNFQELNAYCTDRKVKLLAVSKTRSIEQIMSLYDQGHRDFGENRVQEWMDKQQDLPKDIKWHLIGHLQTNKLKYIIPGIHLIHSVDSLKLLRKIEEFSLNEQVITKVLLQYKIAKEDSKYGIDPLNDLDILEFCQSLKATKIEGVMAMGTFTSDETVLKREFKTLIDKFEELKNGRFKGDLSFKIKSLGMSGDYKLAIDQGSNLVRVGSLLFS